MIKIHLLPTAKKLFSISHIESPLGKLKALADEHTLVWLSFNESESSNTSLRRFLKKHNALIVDKPSLVLTHLASELSEYFQHKRSTFSVPLNPMGTPFQQSVWRELLTIPYGETRSYRDLAIQLQHPTAFRAVAMANAANPISLIIPCHRVINHDGKLGGYSGGLANKAFLLQHETREPTRMSPHSAGP